MLLQQTYNKQLTFFKKKNIRYLSHSSNLTKVSFLEKKYFFQESRYSRKKCTNAKKFFFLDWAYQLHIIISGFINISSSSAEKKTVYIKEEWVRLNQVSWFFKKLPEVDGMIVGRRRIIVTKQGYQITRGERKISFSAELSCKAKWKSDVDVVVSSCLFSRQVNMFVCSFNRNILIIRNWRRHE